MPRQVVAEVFAEAGDAPPVGFSRYTLSDPLPAIMDEPLLRPFDRRVIARPFGRYLNDHGTRGIGLIREDWPRRRDHGRIGRKNSRYAPSNISFALDD